MRKCFPARSGIRLVFSHAVIRGAALGALLVPGRILAQASSINSVYAIVGARIEVGNGKVIEKGTVLLRDGVIEAVGADVKVPPEAEIIKGDGLTVLPGFIDTHATQGVTLPEAPSAQTSQTATPGGQGRGRGAAAAPQNSQEEAYDTTSGAPPYMREGSRKGIRPELRAGDYLTLTDDVARPARAGGFTTELIFPSGGTINGTGALVNLNGMPRRDSIIRPLVAMNFTFRTSQGGFDGGGGRGYPGSLMGIMALTRQTLLDAQHYQALQSAFAKGSSHRPPADDALAALQPVLAGTVPVLFDADSENEIRRAVKMADEFGLKLMLSGATEAYKAAPMLAQHKVPVLVSLNFGPEPGVTAPTGGFGGAGSFGNRPGGTRPGTGTVTPGTGGGGRRRNRPGGIGTTSPPIAADGDEGAAPPVQADPPKSADAQTPPSKPATNEKPGQDQGKPVPPKQDKEDAVTPNANPNQANKPNGAAGENAPKDNPDDENAGVPKAVIAERHAKWEEKVANAARLNQAGVPFAFSTQGVRSQTEFMTNLRRAIRAGLPREVALRALTIDAARMMGVDRQLGTVEAGKTAALVVMSGDFVQPTTRVRYLFIDKSKFEPDRDLGPLPALPTRRFGQDDDDGDEHE